MNKRKEYQRRAQLAKEIAEGGCYRSYPMWGVDYTETIRNIKKRNRKLVKERTDYMAVEGCDYRCVIHIAPCINGTVYELKSYDTEVCAIYCTSDGWYFERTWDGWTPKTMEQVNAFREQFGFPRMNKYEWLMLDDMERK